MALKGWDSSFSVNIPNLDNDHKKMVDMIGQLHQAMSQGKSKDLLNPLINELANYTVSHFSAEEKYLSEKNHPDLAMQKTQHQVFWEKSMSLKLTCKTDRPQWQYSYCLS